MANILILLNQCSVQTFAGVQSLGHTCKQCFVFVKYHVPYRTYRNILRIFGHQIK